MTSIAMSVRSGVCTMSSGYGTGTTRGTPLGRQEALGSNSGMPPASAAPRDSK